MPSNDELSAIKFLNDSEERSSRRLATKVAKDAVAAVSAILPGTGIALGAIVNMLDRREASNREELLSAMLERVQEHSSVLVRLTAQSAKTPGFSKRSSPDSLSRPFVAPKRFDRRTASGVTRAILCSSGNKL